MGAYLRRALANAFVSVLLAVALMPVGLPTQAAALDAVTGVSSSQRPTMAVVSWRPVDGASGYQVQRSLTSDFGSAETLTSASSAVVLTGLSPATSYYVRVAAVSADQNAPLGWSTPFTFTTPAQIYPLGAPKITVGLATTTSLELTWTAPARHLRYEVGVGTDPMALTVTQTAETTHTVSGLKPETDYYLSIRALWLSGEVASDWSSPQLVSTPADAPLRVGSYNVRNGTDKSAPAWSKRRAAVANTIASQKVSVVGLQEATWRHVPGRGVSQYGDIAQLLGSSWKSTTYVGNAGPEGTRIIYDSAQVTLLRQGYQKLAGTHANKNWRYVTWAEFRQLSTGKTFFFVDTHFLQWKNAKGYKSRKSCAQQLVKIVARENPEKLPTIIVGDFNSHKFRKPDNAPHKIITRAGYLDPLDNIDGWRGDGARGVAERRINENFFTINGFKRKAERATGYSTGVMLDQIYVSPMRVAEWETVVRTDSSGRFVGVIPSDHNMVRATVYLPDPS
ncbi:endonuclease/exonuclease/phosphatase family metal-dependent hydrolase [Propionicimonas paludicola]|uniref:Endonuclease/exonuclease/phosphatase family metal-dependent hydrolase n=1 Tax=Propionicimonas paludicola TaxID=185243 RepID=A0A2A9CUL9_9ACTN|nr:fibronectin type III domain-containing protein [Propionicimonas paludicola]PFG17831.1 endonuclease/exonuclease/phosphatase family metal-dependent hydrolase [Propionicimonas paludicola]